MSKNKMDNEPLKQMSKEKLIRQIDLLRNDLAIAHSRALKYYTAYGTLMDHFNELSHETRIELDKKLKDAGL